MKALASINTLRVKKKLHEIFGLSGYEMNIITTIFYQGKLGIKFQRGLEFTHGCCEAM